MYSDPFEAKGEPVELVQGFPYRGDVRWHASDIQGIAEERGLEWDLKMCDDFLFGHEGYLQERLCELGFEVLEDYFREWERDVENE